MVCVLLRCSSLAELGRSPYQYTIPYDKTTHHSSETNPKFRIVFGSSDKGHGKGPFGNAQRQESTKRSVRNRTQRLLHGGINTRNPTKRHPDRISGLGWKYRCIWIVERRVVGGG